MALNRNMITILIFSTIYIITALGQVKNIDQVQANEAINPIHQSNSSFRLPTSLRPVHYNIFLKPYIYGNWTIQGKIEMEVIVKEITNEVILNMADIITLNHTVTMVDSEGISIPILSQSYDPVRQFYIAKLEDSRLKLNNSYIFTMEFQGFLNDKLVGFYRSVYTDAGGKDRWLGATQFSPTDARRAFPCMDEPSFKATFSVSLGRLENMTALSNMPLINTSPIQEEKGWVIDTFNITLPMSTYIVGFLICDFGFIDSNNLTHTQFKVWSRPDALNQAEYANEIAPTILTFFEDYFSLEYPLPKLDMAAIPDFKFNGMENWGLIMYRETAMLYDPNISSASDKGNVASVISHEIAHQWFGNLVTPHWWSDLWLKEGFASFMGYVGVDHIEPTWRVMNQFVKDYIQPVLALDSLESSHPISVVVDNPDQISEIFDLISYRKGASIIRMMQHFLTEPTFRAGLTTYLDDLKYSNAEQDDLWSHLTEAGHAQGTLSKDMTVKEVMDSWTLQEGYPVITITREGKNATLKQKRFLLGNETVNNVNKTESRWWVPITYTSKSNPDFIHTIPFMWINSSQESVEINNFVPDNEWVILNLQQTGYYRVNYDINSWKLLIQQLNINSSLIHESNRAQILDDALNLARAGHLDYNVALNTTTYLKVELENVPWSAALTNLEYIHAMFLRSPAYGGFRDYVLQQLTPLYEQTGFIDNISDPFLVQANRGLTVRWACKLGMADCVLQASSLFKQWLQQNSSSSIVGPNVLKTVLCTGISEGGEEEWNTAWERYRTSNIGAEKGNILSALGCSNEIWILARYLEMCFDSASPIRKQDTARVFGAIASNVNGRDMAWNYLRENWIELRDYVGSGSNTLGGFVRSVAKSFNTETDVNELRKFKEQYSGELGSAVRTVDQMLESSELNVDWMKKYYNQITDWLESVGHSSLLMQTVSNLS